MELNSRMVNILNEIFNASQNTSEAIPICNILSALKISKRTFYYNFEKICQWLKANNLGTGSLNDGLCSLDITRPRELKEVLENSGTNYFMSGEERHALEILHITLASEAMTIDSFQQMFDVSKNTILQDIKKQKESLKEFNLDIKYSLKHGYFIEGEEFSIRKFLGDQVYLLQHIQVKKILYSLLDGALPKLAGEACDFRDKVSDAIHVYEEDVDTDLVQSYVEHEVLMICIAYIRCAQGKHFYIDDQEKETLEKLPAYKGVRKITAFLRESTGINLCEEEIYYITILLLGVKNFDFNSKTEENSYIRDITGRFIANVEENANIIIKEKESLKTRLVSHIGPMYYRVKYGLKIVNPLLDDIKTMYKLAFNVTSKSLKGLDEELSPLIDENEIGYLAMYVGGELSSRGREPKVDQKDNQSVLIVCGAGVAASVLVQNQLIDLMGDNFHFVLCSAGRVKEKDLSQYALIISTVRYGELPDNTIFVGAILSEQDKKKIIAELNKCRLKVPREFQLKELMEVITRFEPDNAQLEKLNFELFKFFHKGV